MINLRKKILFLVIIFAFFIVGCKEKKENNIDVVKNNDVYSILKENNIDVSNSDIDDLNKTCYSIEELEKYFGKYSSMEQSVYNLKKEEYKYLTIENVKKIFPFSFIRENDNVFYSLYEVKEGGMYYIFWGIDSDDKLFVINSIYIKQLKKLEDFKKIIVGKSTFEDIINISSACEIVLNLSSHISSYCLLKDNTVLQVDYDYKKLQTANRLSYVVKSWEKKFFDEKLPTNLTKIYSSDLPK